MSLAPTNTTSPTQAQAAVPPEPLGPGLWKQDNRITLDNDSSRLDVVDKVTGRAKYSTDYYPKNMIWASYIHCPYGNAKITADKLEDVKKMAGVLDAEITKRDGTYPGDRMGHVCAETRHQLQEALVALGLKFAISDPKNRLAEEMTLLEEVPPPENLAAAEEALKSAKLIHEAVYQTQVQTHSPLEVHNALVDFRGDNVVAWASTQACVGYRNDMAKALEMPQDKVEFHCEYIGGGFGAKFGMEAEGLLAAQMSKKFSRPCRVNYSRKIEHEDGGCRPGSHQTMRVGIGEDGKLVGARIHTASLVGPVGRGGGVNNPSRYNFGVVAKTHQDVNANGGFPKTMRAPGHPNALFAIELMLDELAAKLNMDPLQIRLLNDKDTVRQEMMKVGAGMIGWDKRQPNGSGKGPIKRGLGMGVGDWGNNVGRNTSVTVNIHADGTIETMNAAQDIGTGFRTMLATCVASQLGVPVQMITSKVGCSIYPPGPASGGSTTSRTVAPRAQMAATMAREQLLKLVAAEWGMPDAAGLKIENAVIAGGGKTMEWKQACKLIPGGMITVTTDQTGDFSKTRTQSQTVQFAEVEVDTETGIVQVKKYVVLQEVGTAVNRKLVENQITGAVIQGISYSLFEERILNRTNGAMVNPNMDMYKIAGPMEIPEIVPIIWQQNPAAGVNSLGEPTSVPVNGVIACAVYNAIGVPVRQMPLTPARVLAALEDAQGGASA